MHIPDNYLSPSTCIALALVSIPVLKISMNKAKEELGMKKMSSIAVYSAFSFIIMMFNIPLPGGTSGHAVGSALTALLMGPWVSVISTSIALIIQAIFFGDGGIISLGANIFNMAILMPFTAYYTNRILKNFIKKDKFNAFISGYISLNLAALFTAIEFGVQPLLFKDSLGLPLYCPYPLSISIPAMMIPHLLVVGIVEGVFTMGVLSFLLKTTPNSVVKTSKLKVNLLYILLGSLTSFTPLGLLAKGTAWGEWGKEEILNMLGYIPKGMNKSTSINAIMSDYSIKNLSETTGYLLSGIIGIILVFLFFILLKYIKLAIQNKNKGSVD
ncbi:MAG: cobalt transporter CbiM [Fusobacteriaceae bacterium]|nr:cobalt transporter CbiM [Fusobacteriaceae bacterium]